VGADKAPGYYTMADVLACSRAGQGIPMTEAAGKLLVLVRHGQSEWNLQNLFTGWKDPGLTELGVKEARIGGRRLKEQGFTFDIAFTSVLTRAQETCRLILEELGQPGLATIRDQALNERDYGDLSGLNKDDARARWGAEQVHVWRRSYDIAPPGGESLKDTVARVLPYYMQHILPRVMRVNGSSSPRTATRCARSSWSSTASRRRPFPRWNWRPGSRWSTG
jgi:2,3-bisphosphoglycerate-dependent phosphoglycerate mutase